MSRHVWPDLLRDTSRLHSDFNALSSVQTFKSVPFAHYKVWKITRSPLSFRLYLVRGSHAEGVNFIALVPCPHLPPPLPPLLCSHTHTSLYLHPLTHSLSHTFPSRLSAASVSVSSLWWTDTHSLSHSLQRGWITTGITELLVQPTDTPTIFHRGDTHTIQYQHGE